MSQSEIKIRGAATHNLKRVDLDLPRNRLIVLTGLSGSGKSSLAFDTIYAEGQRRYVESLSAYARQFLSLMQKPEADSIEGLSPAISIEQKTSSHNPRSTVGTVTEIHDYLRLLFARVGVPHCPEHDLALAAQSVSQMVEQTLALPEKTRLMLLAPVIQGRKGEYQQLLGELHAQGFIRALIDDREVMLDDPPTLNKRLKHTIEVVVDRLSVRDDNRQRLAESLETALALSDGTVHLAVLDKDRNITQRLTFSSKFACPECGYSLEQLEPRLFSFNNPYGACPTCDGLGNRQYFDPERVVHNADLSLAAGAIRGWDRRQPFYFAQLSAVAEAHHFSVEEPFSSLTRAQQDAVLHGTKEPIVFDYPSPYGGSRRKHTFKGVLGYLERQYKETESLRLRDHLAQYMSHQNCPDCGGSRLNLSARNVFVEGKSLHMICEQPIDAALKFFQGLNLDGQRGKIAAPILREVSERLGFLVDVGLDYLNLARAAETLSGGEAQRIRLASQIGSGLVGVMYVLDEPSIGLHQRDNARLMRTLFRLRDLGNTVIVVEHDREAIESADHVVDMGPGAGRHGGEVVAAGTPAGIRRSRASLTGAYLAGRKQISAPGPRRSRNPKQVLRLCGATGNNLQSIDAEFPLGLLTCVAGVSGSGKSTLVNATLYPAVAQALGLQNHNPKPYETIEGLEHLDKIIAIDQSSIGRTPRSNPATYTGLFTEIRDLFTNTAAARERGYKPGRFSFNVKGGRCEACQGDGVVRVEMHFLPDIYVSCDTCKGLRYNKETLDIRYRGKTISEVLNLSIEEAAEFYKAIPAIKRRLDTLLDVGLGYLTLGHSATNLSGGEAQRIKLSRELSKRDTGRTLYVLDEPTTGLHFADVQLLVNVLHRLRDQGNTIIVIEHNLDLIKTADWVVELGPEGGAGGGKITATGTPEQIARETKSPTGRYLKDCLPKRPKRKAA